MGDFLVGDVVDVSGTSAIVRFVGPTEFSPGEWIGVELVTPSGKNNGTVLGVKYFSCTPMYGMFVKPSVPRLIERPAPPPVPRARPQSRTLAPQQTKRLSGTSSPAPPPLGTKGRSMTLRSPSRPGSAARGLISTPSSSGPSTPRTTTPTIANRASVTSLRPASSARPGVMGPPPSKPAAPKRGSISGPSNAGIGAPLTRTNSSTPSASGTTTPVSRGASRLSLKPSTIGSLVRKASADSASSQRSSPDRRSRTDTIGTPAPPTGSRPLARRDSLAPGGGMGSRTSPSRAPGASTSNAELMAVQRENEDLKSKVKVLEKKRQEDRENLKTLQRVQEERDKYEAIIQKLQQKYQPQAAELVELKKHLKEMEKIVAEVEEIKAEHESLLEMATLDREMAEEQTEHYKAELDAVREKAEELEMELEILREENEELSQGMSPEEKTSAGWLQLEKQNERLREALLRLREITSQTEEELRGANASLEEEVNDLLKFKDEYESIKEKLMASQSAVDDLRQQLETALGAEEMLEELSERNMNMSEQIDEYRATIEDLESLKEISDELEINHIETEKQMQEELDYRDLLITEQSKRIAQLDASNEEAEYTITRFRDLVVNLQNDLEDMKASQQITETEAEELSARSRSMLDINMKLQITAAKAQNKTIDLELRKLEAEEAMEHLAIVQMFLPDSFHDDRDSVLALLRFKRVAFKAGLLQSFVKERLSGQTGQFVNGHEEQLMAACEMCDKLTWVSAMCERFVSCFGSCSVEQFTRFQGALYELDPVERALNGWIEGLRKDELNERNCVAELQRTMALMSHLGEIHLKSDLEGFASDVHMRVLMMQTHMESAAAAVSLVKLAAQKKLPSGPEDEEAAANFAKKADAVISQSRNIKVVVGKTLRALDDFRLRNLSITQDKRMQFEDCEAAAQKLAVYTRAVGEDVYVLLFSNVMDENEQPLKEPTWLDLQNTMFATTERVLRMSESDIFGSISKDLRNLANLLVELASVAVDIDMTAEFERAPAPWLIRAQQLKSTKVVNVDVEEELRRLKYDLHERATQIRLRDITLEESAVKIELLESRMRNVTKQSERIEELEKAVVDGTAREREFSKTLEELNEEVQTLEADVAKWRKAAEDKRAVGETDRLGQERAVATAREVESLKKEITALKGAVTFFRTESDAFKRHDVLAADSWLMQPLIDPVEQALVAYEDELVRESRDVMAELRSLVLEERVVDLNKLIPRDTERMMWKPSTQTPRWTCARQRERYEAVRAWKEDLVGRVKSHVSSPPRKKKDEEGKTAVVGAVVKVALPMGYVDERGSLGEVVVREPDGWEEMRDTLGIVG